MSVKTGVSEASVASPGGVELAYRLPRDVGVWRHHHLADALAVVYGERLAAEVYDDASTVPGLLASVMPWRSARPLRGRICIS